jgi:hypothetical protein
VGLFRKSAEKVAAEAAAQAEIDRLRALPVIELAATLLTALGPDGVNQGNAVHAQPLCQYLLRETPGAGLRMTLQLMGRVNAALEALRDAGLVQSISLQRSPYWRILPLGEETLGDGTVRRRLAGGET